MNKFEFNTETGVARLAPEPPRRESLWQHVRRLELETWQRLLDARDAESGATRGEP